MATPRTDRTNDDWVAEISAQNAEALSDLRAYLCNRLEAVLAGKAGQSDVEDFVQDALQQIADSLDKFRGDSRFTTWATSIAVRVAYSELRRKRWGTVSLDSVVGKGVALDRAAPDAAGAERLELYEALRDAIDESLTERQRAVVIAELHRMPASVLGEELGMSHGAIYKMHHDARKKLRRALEAKGITVQECLAILEGGELT